MSSLQNTEISLIQEKIKEIEVKEMLNVEIKTYHRITKDITVNIFSSEIYIFKDSELVLNMDRREFMRIKSC